MKTEDTESFKFTNKVYDDSFIRCNNCKEISPVNDWTSSEPYCEDCGSHAGMICPKCDYEFDHVWCDEMEVINSEDE